jgi:hypothetical protein
MLMCKVHFTEESLGYRTLGHLRKVNFSDKELFIEYLLERLGILTESYVSQPLNKITFTYIIKNGLAPDTRSLITGEEVVKPSTHRFNNMNLPLSMNPSDYGTVELDNIIQVEDSQLHRYMVTNMNYTYRIDQSLDGLTNNIKILGAIDLNWTDTKLEDNLFKRVIGKSTLYIMDGVIVLRKKQLNAKPFKLLQKDTNLNNNFITMDIETIKVTNKLVPYLICAYNGSAYITSYANESLDQKALFSNFITQLLSQFCSKRGITEVYAHNLSGFDGMFLLRHLTGFGKVEPLLHNGKIITIKLKLVGG